MILIKEKIILIVLVLLVSLPGWCQDVVSIEDLLTDTAFIEKLPIPLADITSNVEQTNIIINDIEERLKISPEQLEKADSILNKIDQDLLNYETLLTEDFLASSSSIQLEKYKSELEQIDNQINEYDQVVHPFAAEMEKENKTVDIIKLIWVTTEKSEISKELSSTVNAKLKEMIQSLNETGKRVNKSLNILLEVQIKLNNQHTEFRKLIKEVNGALTEANKNILFPDSDPIWILFSQKRDTVDISTKMTNLFELRKKETIIYFEEYKGNVFFAIFAILLTQIIFYLIRYRILEDQIEDPKLMDNAILRVFKRPFFPALLIGLYFAYIILPQKPFIIDELMYMAGLIPFTIVLINILLGRNRFLIIFLFIILTLSIFSNVGFDLEVYSRAVMLIITVLSLIWIIIILRYNWEGLDENPLLRKIVRFLAKTVLVVLILCLIGNIIGNYSLTIILLYGLLSSIFQGISLYLFYLITVGFVTVLFNSTWGKSYRIIKRHMNKMIEKIEKVLIFILSVSFIIGLLVNFNLFDPVYNWINEFLITPFTIGSFSITLNDLLLFVVVLIITSWISSFVQFILEEQVLFQAKKKKDLSASISSLVKFSIVTTGFFIAALASGFPLDKITILISAFGVGIGFGLQSIFNNLVSGIILVFERPLQVGDTIEVGNLTGVVKTIGIRASTVRTFDGSEVIVPNGNLISNDLINWTHSDMQRRLIVKVGLKYGTDPKKVIDILLKVAKINKNLMEDPEPYVLFKEFGDSALGFELRVWTDSDDWIFIKSDLFIEVNDALKEAGMVIPFPQRDLHLKSDESGIVTSIKKPSTHQKK